MAQTTNSKKTKRRVVRKKKPSSSKEHSSLCDSIVDGICKRCGEGSAVVLDNFDDCVTSEVRTWVPTGFRNLDMLLSEGKGMPCGKILEVYGTEASGKTALCQYLIREYQKKGGLAVYLDFETSLDKDYLTGYGIDLGNLIYVNVETMEEGFDAVVTSLKQITEMQKKSKEPIPALLVWDSVAMAVPKAEVEEKDHDKSHVGLQARSMSKGMRKIRRVLAKTACTVIFTNQTRQKIGVKFGDPTTTPGGNALRFASSIRLRTAMVGRIKKTRNKKERVVGYNIRIHAKKNRIGNPHQEANLVLSFTKGLDPDKTFLNYLKELGLLRTAAKKLVYLPSDTTVSRSEWKDFLKENRRQVMADVKEAEGRIAIEDDDDEEVDEEVGD